MKIDDYVKCPHCGANTCSSYDLNSDGECECICWKNEGGCGKNFTIRIKSYDLEISK